MKSQTRIKWAVLFVTCDLALAAVVVGLYSFVSHASHAKKRAAFKTELVKAEEEATKHTGR